MLQLTMKGQPVHITNKPISVGQTLSFTASDSKLSIVNINNFPQKFKIISAVPSLDTATCALQTKYFNHHTKTLKDFVTITISKDLPFAQSRFCRDLHMNNNFMVWSDYRNDNTSFANQTHLLIAELQLLARTILILDHHNKVLYVQIVSEVSNEPNYDDVLQFIKTLLK